MEIASYILKLDANTTEALALIKRCNETQLRYKPEGKWNTLEIAEHICSTERLVIALLSKPSANLHGEENVIGNEKLERILVTMRARKVKAPDSLEPKGLLNTAEAFEEKFIAQRQVLKENLLNGKIIIDTRIHKHPIMGEMTITDWMYFIIHHTQRHLEQIKELMNEHL